MSTRERRPSGFAREYCTIALQPAAHTVTHWDETNMHGESCRDDLPWSTLEELERSRSTCTGYSGGKRGLGETGAW